MHVFDYIVDCMSRLFKFHNYIKTVKSIEEIATAIAITNNTLLKTKTEGGVIPG
ncbi:MAG: hypothetical protein QW756_07425 [Nitrososphaerota archaeon]